MTAPELVRAYTYTGRHRLLRTMAQPAAPARWAPAVAWWTAHEPLIRLVLVAVAVLAALTLAALGGQPRGALSPETVYQRDGHGPTVTLFNLTPPLPVPAAPTTVAQP